MKKTALLIALMCALSACNVSVHSNGKVTRYNLLDEAIKAAKAPSEKKKALNQALFQAVIDNDINQVRSLLQQGVDANTRDKLGQTPLMVLAFNHDNTEIAQALLNGGADIEAKDDKGDTPLAEALWGGKPNLTRFLIEKGANVNAKTNDGITPLHQACAGNLPLQNYPSITNEGRLSAMKILIANKADINATDNKGLTPFDHALKNKNNKQFTELLVEKGAKLNNQAQSELGSLLFSAVESNNTAFVRSLIKQGANPDARDKDKQTPLMVLAFHHDNTEIAQALLDGGADIEARDNNGDTPLAEAVWGGKPNLTRFLIAKGANVNAKTNDGRTPLHQACEGNLPLQDFPSITNEGRMSAIKILIENKANVNAKDNQGETPFDHARKKAPSDIENLLKKYGAKHSDAYIAQQKADKERAKREEREYARKRKCEHIYVGKTFKQYYGTHRFGGQRINIIYEVRGFSPAHNKVTGMCIDIENPYMGAMGTCDDASRNGLKNITVPCSTVD